jgi:hypothetical protein
MTALLPRAPSDVVWRRLRPQLWVGRADNEHLGTIERGRRFTATDTAGRMQGGYRSLQAAQAALTGEIPVVEPSRVPDGGRAATALLACTTAAMLTSAAMAMTGIAVLR